MASTPGNIYQTPAADLLREEDQAAEFYVVGRIKFWVLSIATLGLYEVYWSYRHWRNYKNYHSATTRYQSIWPVARGIFSIFFVHSLFRLIDNRLRQDEHPRVWRPFLQATLYVVFSIVGYVVEAFESYGFSEAAVILITLGSMMVVLSAMHQGQLSANIVCNDAEGVSNSRFGLANYACILFGFVVWALFIFGILIMGDVVDVE